MILHNGQNQWPKTIYPHTGDLLQPKSESKRSEVYYGNKLQIYRKNVKYNRISWKTPDNQIINLMSHEQELHNHAPRSHEQGVNLKKEIQPEKRNDLKDW